MFSQGSDFLVPLSSGSVDYGGECSWQSRQLQQELRMDSADSQLASHACNSLKDSEVGDLSASDDYHLFALSTITQLKPSYEVLPQEQFRAGWYRRFSSVLYNSSERTIIEHTPDNVCYPQSSVLHHKNMVNKRRFEPLQNSVLSGPAMHKLLEQFTALVLRNDPARRALDRHWGHFDSILINQIRAVVFPVGHSERREMVQPIPNNIFQDWMMIACVRRANVEGGVSSLHYCQGDQAFMTVQLEEGMALFVNDKELFHHISPIVAVDPHQKGVCDMIILSLNPLDM